MLTARLFEDRREIHPTSETMRPRLTIIGDVRVEMRASLEAQSFACIHKDTFCMAPIQSLVSGTAVNMAKATASLFETTVIAKIGSDDFTDLVLKSTSRIDADWHLMVDEGAPNGQIMIIRDDEAGKHGGNRLLISGVPAPVLNMSVSDIREQRLAIQRSDLLFTDGYTLLSDSGRKAIMEALRIAADAGVVTCIDLVPHNISEYLSLADLSKFLCYADIIICNARTLINLHGEQTEHLLAHEKLWPLLERITCLGLPVRYWILRFGIGDMQETAILQPEGDPIHYTTGYINTSKHAGFGDRVAAWELRQLMNHLISG